MFRYRCDREEKNRQKTSPEQSKLDTKLLTKITQQTKQMTFNRADFSTGERKMRNINLIELPHTGPGAG